MKKIVLIMGMLLMLVLVLGVALYAVNSAPRDGNQEQRVSWDEAVTILNSGDVAQVTQLHNLTVTLILKDGTQIVTAEPAIDDIWDEIRKCGEPCEEMIMATE